MSEYDDKLKVINTLNRVDFVWFNSVELMQQMSHSRDMYECTAHSSVMISYHKSTRDFSLLRYFVNGRRVPSPPIEVLQRVVKRRLGFSLNDFCKFENEKDFLIFSLKYL